jgi:hypothetical protein
LIAGGCSPSATPSHTIFHDVVSMLTKSTLHIAGSTISVPSFLHTRFRRAGAEAGHGRKNLIQQGHADTRLDAGLWWQTRTGLDGFFVTNGISTFGPKDAKPVTGELIDPRLADVEALARRMDYGFVLPGGFRFGLSGVIGLIPGIGDIGDIMDALISLYIPLGRLWPPSPAVQMSADVRC